MAATETQRSQHVCSMGCGCRNWTCADCGTSQLVDRETRYRTEPEGPDTYAVELCTVCGAPVCDECLDGDLHECPGRAGNDRA